MYTYKWPKIAAAIRLFASGCASVIFPLPKAPCRLAGSLGVSEEICQQTQQRGRQRSSNNPVPPRRKDLMTQRCGMPVAGGANPHFADRAWVTNCHREINQHCADRGSRRRDRPIELDPQPRVAFTCGGRARRRRGHGRRRGTAKSVGEQEDDGVEVPLELLQLGRRDVVAEPGRLHERPARRGACASRTSNTDDQRSAGTMVQAPSRARTATQRVHSRSDSSQQ